MRLVSGMKNTRWSNGGRMITGWIKLFYIEFLCPYKDDYSTEAVIWTINVRRNLVLRNSDYDMAAELIDKYCLIDESTPVRSKFKKL